MRVITGKARGIKLISPEGTDIRPTSEAAKEAIFSMLQNEMEGSKVLDLFAGSGQMGIEALSRGAQLGVFVDISQESQKVVRENLRKTGLAPGSRVVAMDYTSFLRGTSDKFDIAFLDPPYDKDIISAALPMVAQVMKPEGAIVCESDRREDLPQSAGEFELYRVYRYGKAKVTVYRLPQEER